MLHVHSSVGDLDFCTLSMQSLGVSLHTVSMFSAESTMNALVYSLKLKVNPVYIYVCSSG